MSLGKENIPHELLLRSCISIVMAIGVGLQGQKVGIPIPLRSKKANKKQLHIRLVSTIVIIINQMIIYLLRLPRGRGYLPPTGSEETDGEEEPTKLTPKLWIT